MGNSKKMKMTHKNKSSSSKVQKPSNSRPIAAKNSPKTTLKTAAKPSKKDFDFKKKNKFTPIAKSEKNFKDKNKKPLSSGFKNKKIETKKNGFSSSPAKSQKKEIKIVVSSFKKEHLKKQEQKKREHEKNLELKTQKLKEEQKKHKKQTDKKPELGAKGLEVRSDQSIKTKKAEAKSLGSKDVKKLKNQKPKEEDELDDAFLSDDDSNEIEEYAEDLKAVEEADLEIDEAVIFETEVKEKNFEEINLTDAEGNLLCRSRDCDQVAKVDGYCRYHYLLFWKKIQVRKKILTDGKLARYVEELTSRYPDKFLEMIRRDLRTQKDFLSAIQELEIDESSLESDFEEDTQTFIDEVRGINETTNIDEEFE